MTLPKAGDKVQTERGTGIVEFYHYRITYPGGGKSYYLCTVRLDTPFKDRQEKAVLRIEAELPIQEEAA